MLLLVLESTVRLEYKNNYLPLVYTCMDIELMVFS